MLNDTCPVCGLPKDLCVCSDVEKSVSVIDIKIEKRKYGKLWAIITGVDDNPSELKQVLKHIKTKLACGGTIKGKTIEILYGKQDRNKELISALVDMGFNRDAIHIS